MTLLEFTLAAMALLAPGRSHDELALAVAQVVDAADPLFAHDEDKHKTAALAIAVLFREGSLGLHVEGDRRNGKPTSWCSAQINLSPGAKTVEGWTGPELRDDPIKCVTVEMRMLRVSVRVDPEFPIAFYASGPAWKSDRARRISRDRVWLAKRIAGAAR